MPLSIPGLNEAAAKTFTKRLHKSLKQREDTPSLTQLQILVAQAIGHADWHAAQAYWNQGGEVEAGDTPPIFHDTRADELTLLLRNFAVLMAQAKNGSHASLKDLTSCLFFLVNSLEEQETPVERELLRQALRLSEDLRKVRGKSYTLGLQRLERLVQRAEVGLVRSFLPGHPVPVLPPPPPGVVDEPVVLNLPPTQEEIEERRRLQWERFDEERRAEKEKQRIEQRPLVEETLSKAMAFLKRMKSGDERAWDLLLQENQRLVEIEHKSANLRLKEAMAMIRRELGQTPKDPALTQLRLSRIENHLLRARAMLMEYFCPEASRDTFPTAEEALFKGAVTVGEWRILQKSIDQASNYYAFFRSINCEDAPAVSELCAWWNATAPEGCRGAGAFLIGALKDTEVKFLGSEFEKEPPVFADEFAQDYCYAVFTSPHGVHYAVVFSKGQAHNKDTPDGVQVLQVNGNVLWDWDVEETSEANLSFYSTRCLYEIYKLRHVSTDTDTDSDIDDLLHLMTLRDL